MFFAKGRDLKTEEGVVVETHGAGLQTSVPVEEDRTVLEDGAAVRAHRRADELAAPDNNLASGGGLEAGNGGLRVGKLQVDLAARELGIDTERSDGPHQCAADRPVGLLQSAWQRALIEGRKYRIGQLEMMEERPPAGGRRTTSMPSARQNSRSAASMPW